MMQTLAAPSKQSRRLGRWSVLWAMMFVALSGCRLYGFDPVMRQVTEAPVAPPTNALSGLQTQPTLPRSRQRVNSAGQTFADPFGTGPQVNQGPRPISNDQLWAWRAEGSTQYADHDPHKRPRRLPAPFVQVEWGDYLPLMPKGTKAKLSSDYGWRNRYGRTDFHSGIDIVAPIGTPVFAPVDGIVISSPRGGAEQTGVVVLSGERQYSFWHMTPNVQAGDYIRSGQAIGKLANWGNRTHLHFAVHLSGQTVDSQVRNDFNAVDPISTTWRAMNSGIDLFAPSSSQTSGGGTLLNMPNPVLSALGY